MLVKVCVLREAQVEAELEKAKQYERTSDRQESFCSVYINGEWINDNSTVNLKGVRKACIMMGNADSSKLDRSQFVLKVFVRARNSHFLVLDFGVSGSRGDPRVPVKATKIENLLSIPLVTKVSLRVEVNTQDLNLAIYGKPLVIPEETGYGIMTESGDKAKDKGHLAYATCLLESSAQEWFNAALTEALLVMQSFNEFERAVSNLRIVNFEDRKQFWVKTTLIRLFSEIGAG